MMDELYRYDSGSIVIFITIQRIVPHFVVHETIILAIIPANRMAENSVYLDGKVKTVINVSFFSEFFPPF